MLLASKLTAMNCCGRPKVGILVDDGSGGDYGCGTDDDATEVGTVEAGTLGTVVATDTLYDTNLSDANGCDPAGCAASLTRVRS